MSRHWYPKADATRQPSPWWYFGRAVYVSRRDYRKIFFAFLAVGLPLGLGGLFFDLMPLFWAACGLAVVGLVMLFYSLFGLYRMYGHSAKRYLRQLLALGKVEGKVVLADLHIGTYRHAYTLAELLPEATIHTIDCWNMEGPPAEEAIADVRALEPPPQGHPRITPHQARQFMLPLPDASCDVVVFGFGTHEVSAGEPREKLFREAQRILKPGGTALLFEHGQDWHNWLIFGPVIHHVTTREEWRDFLARFFRDVRYGRSTAAVDLFAASRG
jgi:ubiquinone/menaquinone biosynthesis C-methylase UbiE